MWRFLWSAMGGTDGESGSSVSVLAGRCGRDEDSPRTGDRRAPFAHHRKENGGGKQREDQALGSHYFNYLTGQLCATRPIATKN